MNMKRRLMAIFAAMLIAASMTACGNGKKDDSTTDGSTVDIKTENTTNGNETTEEPSKSESDEATTESETETDAPNEIKDPGEYTYTSIENAECIQVLSSTGAATLRTADYKEVTSVPNGTKLDRIGISNGANGYWSQVVYNGEICYIASHLVTSIIELDDGFVSVDKVLIKNDGSLKIRIAPDLNSEVVGYISAGQEVIVVAENTTTGWYKISFIPYGSTEPATGYVSSNPEYYEPEIDISVPDGYSAYIDGNVAFLYPENWVSLSEGDQMKFDQATGDNYVIVYENYTEDHEIYFSLTNELFAEIFLPMYESIGQVVTDYDVKQDTKGDSKVAVIALTNMTNGQPMYQTQFIFVTKSNHICTLTVTAASAESNIATSIYESLIIAK